MIPRDLALSTLNYPEQSPGFAARYLERAFQDDPQFSEQDRRFTLHLVQGVFRWRLRLDWFVRQFVRFSFKKINPSVLNILRIALYQIFFMDRIPDFAAINEAVKQVKAIGKGPLSGFVNGILREICRQKDNITFPGRENNPIRHLSVVHSYPDWLVEKWVREVGIDSTEKLLQAGNRIPGLVIRCNMLKIGRMDLIRRLEEENLGAKPTHYSPDGIMVTGLSGPVNKLDAFREGLFQVQGEAAQICSHLLQTESGRSILDLCAGMGGKSIHLAQLTGGKQSIIAVDTNLNKLLKLKERARILGLGCIRPVAANSASHLSSLFNSSFSNILVDCPCSGLGVISKHPDGKWVRDEKDISRLSHLQIKILNEAGSLLRDRGAMLYTTCTISREENEDVVNDFLKKNDDMILVHLKSYVPEWGLDLIDDNGFFRTFPHLHGMDGFFGALFIKKQAGKGVVCEPLTHQARQKQCDLRKDQQNQIADEQG